VVRAGAPTPYFGDQYVSLARFFFNHETGQITWFLGSPINVPAAKLHSRAAFWTGGRYVAIACVGDQEICLALSAYWTDILRRNALPFLIFALAGGLIGSAASVMTMVWRHQRHSLYRRLRQAMRRGELVMVYQPIVAAASRAMIGAEALMRWTERGGVDVPPDVFIPVAEEGGLIGDLTCFAIRSVSRELGDLLRGNPDFGVSINIVADDLEDPRFHDALSVHIDGAGIPPGQIALELTERRAAQVEAADVVINALRGRGFRIYIDDFGTGYSSLTHLSDLSVDAIKLDKSFTKTVDTSAARSRLVPPIMDMAREIGVPVIVEGVETEFQAAYFARCGASLMQGWLFGRPVGAGELVLAARVRAKRVAVSGVV
jgi:sensor c-di-GMP phosphodiesterase-like protein